MRGLGIVGLLAAILLSLSLAARDTRSASVGAPNVILFIGDGLGPNQMKLGLDYARVVQGRPLHLETLMENGDTGYALPLPYQAVVIDSASSATQMGTGQPARNETLGLDTDGRESRTILEWAEDRGLATGLVTNMRLTHATPAAFATHHVSRYGEEHLLADQLLGGRDIDVLLGGGARAFVPRGERTSESLSGIPTSLDEDSRRGDARNLIDEARGRGYTIVSDRDSLRDGAATALRLLGLFAANNLPYVLDRRHERLDGVPSLPELTQAALQVLAKNEGGFFLMVEGGLIDYAGHDNDAATLLQEILDFDEALGLGLRFQSDNPQTLVVVTADHGTGGFSFTYSGWRGEQEPLANGQTYRPRWYYPGEAELRLLGRQDRSFWRILERAGADPAKLQEEVQSATGLSLTSDEAARVLARNPEGHAETSDFREFYTEPEVVPLALLGRALSRQTSVVWSTGGHTSDPALTFGIGPGAEGLRGVYRNTHLHDVMKRSLEAAE